MTTAADVRERILAQAITAQAHNQRQATLTYSPGGPVDSIIEHALTAARGATGARREHLRQIVLLGQQVLLENRHERGCERTIAGDAEHVGRTRWTIRRLGDELGPLLADIANPAITGNTERARLERLAEILAEAPEPSLRCDTLHRRLRDTKWRLLQRFLDDTVLERLA